ncbi:ATP-binding cassette subfamily B protein/subfamily B ATP-binding cassette protein MsbA [Natranaerovirga pectinivora]|uniref:ATP-binding cassette subfamily B protein/subfamily B ATP-binding cassette protein MsbA n=1 Tax=Natranaerovirga pectinivora TaxID=682400 RepID=A0A4R3MI25_9FIRM|nr:ABC transporter ATP-binding protein [Natranaerovirga pectinivora]TCT12897.1 ATP-binding cassette subfamily B protein/subfamily B ATP-binding cassette protein MsbA [Natranaerovirga pectinivora]
MKLLWKLGKEAIKYRTLYIIAIFSTFALTLINLTAPKILSSMTALLEDNVNENTLKDIGTLTVILFVLYLLKILFRFLSNYLAHKAAWNLVEELRIRVYNRIQGFSMGFFSDKQTGDLMSRVVNDTATFELLYAHIIPEMITNVVTVVGVVIILLTINAKLALLTFIPIPFILFSGWIFATKVRPKFRVSQMAIAELNAKLQDNFSGVHEIQAFCQESYESEQVLKKAGVFTKSMLYALKLSAIFHPAVEFLSSIGTIIVVGFGGFLAFHGELSISDIVAFLLYLTLFYAPISGLARLLEEMQQAYAGAERVMMILDTPRDIKNAPNAKELTHVQGSITFDSVAFEYEKDVPIVKDIDFSCEPGQMIALVGPTGVGKTTLTQLISRFYDPTNGKILIDGIDIKEVTLESLRSNIAPVLQDTFLFNGTIGENIGYANSAADLDEIVAAAKAARIHDNIMEMPAGYHTKVGERGMRLSGGQKQRIAIARAILRKAPIIILDEATASVDVETEKEIQKAISDLAGSRTIVAIAHRLSTIKNADLILVLENGKVVQKGTHLELLEQEGLYKRLNLAQNNK